MDIIFIMIFKNYDGKITDIREATYYHFFRKDGSFRSDTRALIQNNIKDRGTFSFGMKRGFNYG